MCWFVPLGLALGASASTAAAVGGMATLSIASTAAGIAGQAQQARQQRKFQSIASQQEAIRAKQEATAMRIKQDQEMQARQSELFAIQQRAKASIARATVAAGEAGVSGTSVDLLLDDYYRQMGNYQYALTREQGFQDVATGLALQDAGQRSVQNQVNIDRPVNAPNFLESVTSIGSAIPQGMSQGYNLMRARGIR